MFFKKKDVPKPIDLPPMENFLKDQPENDKSEQSQPMQEVALQERPGDVLLDQKPAKDTSKVEEASDDFDIMNKELDKLENEIKDTESNLNKIDNDLAKLNKKK